MKTVTATPSLVLPLGRMGDMIAPHEGTQASQAYSIGKAFVYAGKLYKATAAIASGDAIVPNTNCTQTTLAEMIGG